MITDVRRALDDKDVDAISIATPNHWHSLDHHLGLPGGGRMCTSKTVQPQHPRRPNGGRNGATV